MKNKKAQVEVSEGIILVKIFIYIMIFAVLLIVLFGSFYIIEAGQRGIILTFGNPDMSPKSEGLHFKIPIVQSIIKMDIKTQKYEADASAASKDLQTVTSKIVTNYHLESASVPIIYKEIGIDYQTRVIQPLEQEIVKATTARYTAEELITKRELVRLEIKQTLHDRLLPRGIVVEEVSITNFDFSPSFNAAIEAKVTAEQNALAAKNKLEQVKYEAEQRIAQATAEAEAIRIQAQAITAQGGKDYVQLQWILKWDGKVSLVSTGNSQMNSLIDISSLIQ